jgi:hypothetical protein
MEENTTYWKRIKANIKQLKKDGKITKRYTFESFCNNFIPFDEPLAINITDKCLCNHNIIYNYKYVHKERDDWFILGSCCIKKFSTIYKKQRICKDCGQDIKKNKTNLCKICREIEKDMIKQEKKRKCKCCGNDKKDYKYKYCYYCFLRSKRYID